MTGKIDKNGTLCKMDERGDYIQCNCIYDRELLCQDCCQFFDEPEIIGTHTEIQLCKRKIRFDNFLKEI